jgi:hypothetical protein
MIQLFMDLSQEHQHQKPVRPVSEWYFGILGDGAALRLCEPAELTAMRGHQVDGVERGVSEPKKMPELMGEDLLVCQRRPVRFRPRDLNDLGAGECKRSSFDRMAINRLQGLDKAGKSRRRKII